MVPQRFSAAFEARAQTEGHAVDVGEVGGDLGDVQDLVIGEAGGAERIHVITGHGHRFAGEFGGVVDDSLFARSQARLVACNQFISQIVAIFSFKQAPQPGGVVEQSVFAAVKSTYGDGYDLPLDTTHR